MRPCVVRRRCPNLRAWQRAKARQFENSAVIRINLKLTLPPRCSGLACLHPGDRWQSYSITGTISNLIMLNDGGPDFEPSCDRHSDSCEAPLRHRYCTARQATTLFSTTWNHGSKVRNASVSNPSLFGMFNITATEFFEGRLQNVKQVRSKSVGSEQRCHRTLWKNTRNVVVPVHPRQLA